MVVVRPSGRWHRVGGGRRSSRGRPWRSAKGFRGSGDSAGRSDSRRLDARRRRTIVRGTRAGRRLAGSAGGGPEGPGWGPPRLSGPPERGRGGPDERPLTPKEREELAEFVRRHFPEMHRRLQRFQRSDPGRYGQSLGRLSFPMLRLMRLSKTDPELAEVMIAEHRVEMELADWQDRYVKQTSTQARAECRSRIRELVGRQFDLRQRRLDMEIRNMQRRLDEALARLSQQSAARTEIIEEQVRRMVDRLEKGRSLYTQPAVPPGDAPRAVPQGAPPERR